MRPLGPARLRALLAAFVAALLSCVDAPTAPRLMAITTATPEALSLFPLDTAWLSAQVRGLDGAPIPGATLQWRSLDTTVASVLPSGLVTARDYTGPAVRQTSILVTAAEASTDTVPVEVLPWQVARVIADSQTATLAVGGSTSLGVRLEAANGTPLTDRDILWIADDTAVVRVNATGLVTARPYFGPLERSTRVIVFAAGLSDTTVVTVLPVTPASLQLAPSALTLLPGAVDSVSVVVRSAAGDTLREFPLLWESTDTTVARVNIEGIVTASYYVGAATRSATVTVTLGGLVDSTLVHVLPLAIATVDIAPDSVSLLPGAAAQFDVTIRDAAGLFLEGRAVTWTSLDTTVARVDASGRVTALASGDTATRSALVVASAAATADTVRITVSPHAVAWVTATPEALSLMPGDTLRIAASLAALDLTILTDRRVDWQSLNPAIAAVDSSGLVSVPLYTGPSLRNTAVVLSSGGAADTVPVEVLPLPVARAIATPTAISLAPGDSADLGATVESATGVVLSGRGLLWLSSDTAVIAVDSASGRVTARPYLGQATRTAAVVVYSEGVADTVDVTVTPLVPALLEAAPDTLAIVPGQQASLSATIRASSGAALSGLTVSWASSDTSIAIVNADGIVTAVFYVGADERPTSIVATSGALADTVHLRVLPLAVDSIAVFPDTQTLRPEQTLQLSAVLRDSAGLFLSGRVVAWTSSDTVLATVSDSGVVTALVAGEVSITASSGGVSAAANITIEPVVTTVRVTPGLSTVWIGRTQPFSVALQDTNGASPTGRRVRWRSTDPGVATVDSLGVVTGLAPGLVSVIATSEGRADSATVDVFAEPTAAVTISFDDSWRGVLELAYPEMQALRLRANVGWITNVDWAGVMNPTELRQLQDAGWSIVSHSATHPYLTAISIDSARAELARSRARIDSLGFDPRVFIAPYLDHNDAVLLESAAAGYTYTRCCAQDSWSTDTLVQWPIQPAGRHRLAGVDLTNYDGQVTSYNFRTVEGRDRLRTLLNDVVAAGKFLDVFFHDIVPEDLPDLRLTLEILADFRPYLITYGMLPD